MPWYVYITIIFLTIRHPLLSKDLSKSFNRCLFNTRLICLMSHDYSVSSLLLKSFLWSLTIFWSPFTNIFLHLLSLLQAKWTADFSILQLYTPYYKHHLCLNLYPFDCLSFHACYGQQFHSNASCTVCNFYITLVVSVHKCNTNTTANRRFSFQTFAYRQLVQHYILPFSKCTLDVISPTLFSILPKYLISTTNYTRE